MQNYVVDKNKERAAGSCFAAVVRFQGIRVDPTRYE